MVRLWDLERGHCSKTLSGHTESVISICLSPPHAAAPVIGSGSLDKTIILWSIDTGEALRTLRGHKGVVTGVAISKDLELPVLVSCSNDRCIICWRLSDGQQLGSILGHSAPVTSLVLSNFKIPVIISGSDDMQIKIWEMESGTYIDSLKGHKSEVNALAISRNPSNPIIVSGSADGSVMVWDLLRLRLKYVLVSPVDGTDLFNKAHRPWEVSSVAVTDNAFPIILTATWTSSVRIWSSKTGDLLRVLESVHTRRVCDICVGVNHSGPVLVTSSHDGLAVIWSPEDDLLVGSAQELSAVALVKQMDLEQSLVIAGKYLCYWSVVLQARLCASGSSSGWEEGEFPNLWSVGGGTAQAFLSESDISPVAAAVIVRCLLRLGTINPQLLRVKAYALNYAIGRALPVVDLLERDPFLLCSPLQFLIENRMCMQRTSEWMKTETNIERIVSTLADAEQSVDTLDSILTAVISDDRLGGWDTLLPNAAFETIFRNLVLNCRRSHKKIAAMLRSRGMEVESEPYPSPLDVDADKAKVVVRWNEVRKGVGVFCYRIIVNRYLPMDFLLSDEFLGAIAESEDVNELVTVPLVHYLIQHKWESWGRDMILQLGLFYLIYLATTTVAVMAICTGEFVDLSSHVSYILCIFISIFCNTVWMGLTLWEWSRAASHTAFFSNMWNVSDVTMTILCHFCIIIGAIKGPIDVVRVMSTVLTLLLWSHSLYFGRGQRTFSTLIYTMKVIIWDVRFFMLILLLILLAFAISFRVLGVFVTFRESFVRIFNMMFGDLHYDMQFEGHWMATAMYLIFLVSVVIILLNSLIAFMENSFREATCFRDRAATVSQLRLVTELKVKLFPLLSLYSKLISSKSDRADANQGDLVVLSPEVVRKPDISMLSQTEMLQKLEGMLEQTQSRTSDISASLSKELSKVHAKVHTLEARVVGIESKLDCIINMLSRGGKVDKTQSSCHIDPTGPENVLDSTHLGEEDGIIVSSSHTASGDS